MALNGAFCGQNANVSAVGDGVDTLCRGTNDAQYAAIGIEMEQVALLNGSQSFCRCGVATQDNEMATLFEELEHGLPGELINHFEGTRTIGCTGVIAQIEIVVLGELLAYFVQDGESAIARIEDADGPRRIWKHGHGLFFFPFSGGDEFVFLGAIDSFGS